MSKEKAEIVRRAAKFARANVEGNHVITAPGLDALAERVERGDVDASDMLDEPSYPWSSVIAWAESRGIDVYPPEDP